MQFNHVAILQCIKSCRYRACDLSDFDWDFFAGARLAGWIFQKPLISRRTVSRFYTEWCKIKERKSSEWQFCRQKCLVAEGRGDWPDWFKLVWCVCSLRDAFLLTTRVVVWVAVASMLSQTSLVVLHCVLISVAHFTSGAAAHWMLFTSEHRSEWTPMLQ